MNKTEEAWSDVLRSDPSLHAPLEDLNICEVGFLVIMTFMFLCFGEDNLRVL